MFSLVFLEFFFFPRYSGLLLKKKKSKTRSLVISFIVDFKSSELIYVRINLAFWLTADLSGVFCAICPWTDKQFEIN